MRNINWYSIHLFAFVTIFTVVLIGVVKAADVTVSDAWIRALPVSVPSGGYFTLHNRSGKSVSLIGASSPACGMLMLHQSENTGGMTSMKDVASVNVPAGSTMKFLPGGYHLMCMNATKAIKPGGTVPVTLNFADGQKVVANFAVKNAAGQ